MNYGVVSSAQVGKYGRMGAGFHLAVQSVAADIAALEQQGHPEALIAQLEKVATRDLAAVLEPLVAGSSLPSRKSLDAAIKRHPYVAYALVAKARESLRQQAQARVATEQDYINTLASLPGIPAT